MLTAGTGNCSACAQLQRHWQCIGGASCEANTCGVSMGLDVLVRTSGLDGFAKQTNNLDLPTTLSVCPQLVPKTAQFFLATTRQGTNLHLSARYPWPLQFAELQSAQLQGGVDLG